MANWAINLESIGRENSLLASDRLKLPKTIKQDDRILLYRIQGEDVVFLQNTSVEFAKTESISGVGEDVVAIQLRAPINLPSPSSLSAMTFSLELISRFDEPSKHFNKNIRKILDDDYETLEKQSIFWARSAFGFYANALPTDRFIEFVQFVATSAPGLLIESPKFLILWPLLRDWIEDEYINAVHYATAIRDTVSRVSIAGTSVPFNRIRVSLSDEKQASSGLLSRLVSNLESFYFSSTNTPLNVLSTKGDLNSAESVFDEIDKMIVGNLSSEQLFEKAFAGKKWPITRPIKI